MLINIFDTDDMLTNFDSIWITLGPFIDCSGISPKLIPFPKLTNNASALKIIFAIAVVKFKYL